MQVGLCCRAAQIKAARHHRPTGARIVHNRSESGKNRNMSTKALIGNAGAPRARVMGAYGVGRTPFQARQSTLKRRYAGFRLPRTPCPTKPVKPGQTACPEGGRGRAAATASRSARCTTFPIVPPAQSKSVKVGQASWQIPITISNPRNCFTDNELCSRPKFAVKPRQTGANPWRHLAARDALPFRTLCTSNIPLSTQEVWFKAIQASSRQIKVKRFFMQMARRRAVHGQRRVPKARPPAFVTFQLNCRVPGWLKRRFPDRNWWPKHHFWRGLTAKVKGYPATRQTSTRFAKTPRAGVRPRVFRPRRGGGVFPERSSSAGSRRSQERSPPTRPLQPETSQSRG